MYNLNDFDNKILICPSDIKAQILKQINKQNKLYNIKFMSLPQLYSELTFNISKEMIYFVMKEYNVSVDIAKVYLESIKEVFFIETSDINKVKILLDIKRKLIDNGFINTSSNEEYYKKCNIVVFGYNFIELKYKRAFSSLNNIKYISTTSINKKKLVVNKFKTIEEEITFVLTEIVKLIKNNVDINKIKISGASEEYHYLLKKFSKMFNVSINIKNEKSLYDIAFGKMFLKSIKEGTYEKTLEDIAKRNKEIANLIVNILNDYTFTEDYQDVFTMIQDDFKKTFINENTNNDVKVIDFDTSYFESDEHIFVLGINQGKMPTIIKDEAYITDDIKIKLGLSTSVEINKYNKEKTVSKLFSINNLVMSFSEKLSFADAQESTIFNEYGIEILDMKVNDFSHSHTFNQFKLAEKLDDYTKYNVEDNDLYDLATTYSTKDYDSYDNSFKGIEQSKIQKLLKNEVNLSYTSLEKYNNCGFKYYIDYILKLNIYEDTIQAKIGKLFHYVLSKAFIDDFDFEKEFKYSVNDTFKDASNKEKFLLNRLKIELEFLIKAIKAQLSSINYTQSLFEKEVNIKITNNCTINFKGIIDKVMYEEIDGVVYAALLDYKTGAFDSNICLNYYGLNLQLPIYVYLLKKASKKQICVTGFYYQPILSNQLKAEDEEDYENKKYKYYRLEGYTVDIDNNELKFDKNESNSSIIKSLKRNADGSFSKNSKVLTETQIAQIERLVEEKIINTSNNIYLGKFDINPKKIKKESSCRYCNYKDICFRKETDHIVLDEKKDLSFLEEYK